MEKNANTENFDRIKRTAERDFALLVDSLEEINYRQSAFLRALHAPTPDSDRISKHARVLRDLYHDTSDLMSIYSLQNSEK